MHSMNDLTDLLFEADIIDPHYDVSGGYVFKPYGTKMREIFYSKLREIFEDRDYKKTDFPILVPKEYMRPKEEIIGSFEEGLCWVTRYGEESLENPYFLRPTGESQIYSVAKRWIKSKKDLPMRIFCINYMHRNYHGGNNFINGQGPLMLDGHGFFKEGEEARKEFDGVVDAFEEFISSLGLEHLVVDRPIWGNNPVSEKTVGFDILTEFNKTMQSASVYLLGETYSKPYDITFTNSGGNEGYIEMINFGTTMRLLGLHLIMLSDNRGLRIHPDFSPVQVVFIPIKNSEREIEFCKNLSDELTFRTKIDDSDREVGGKFEDWELKGVPLRIEVGPEEVENGKITAFRRDINKRRKINPDTEKIEEMMDDIKENIKSIIPGRMEGKIVGIDSPEKIEGLMRRGKIASFYWCGGEECGKYLEDLAEGEILGIDFMDKDEGKCIKCGKSGARKTYFSRRF